MSDPLRSLIRQIAARLRGLLPRANEHSRPRTFQLREYAALPKDMPWYPRVPQLTPEDSEVLHWLRQELRNELGPTCIIRDSDLLYLALRELQLALRSPARDDELLRLRFYLAETKPNRV